MVEIILPHRAKRYKPVPGGAVNAADCMPGRHTKQPQLHCLWKWIPFVFARNVRAEEYAQQRFNLFWLSANTGKRRKNVMGIQVAFA